MNDKVVVPDRRKVPGVILILTCHKHLTTRMVEYRLPKNCYAGWEVVYVIGGLRLGTEYSYNEETRFLTVRCEDSYIHLLKKLVLAMKYVSEIYDIQEGILRCGDDVIFNYSLLESFLRGDKPDFYGCSRIHRSDRNPERKDLRRIVADDFMVRYYQSHPEDFHNPLHGLTGRVIKDYVMRPDTPYAVLGVIFYLSQRAVQVLVGHMEEIQYDVFHRDEYTGSYPYTIEDCSVTFILHYHGIGITHFPTLLAPTSNGMSPEYICYSTNKYH